MLNLNSVILVTLLSNLLIASGMPSPTQLPIRTTLQDLRSASTQKPLKPKIPLRILPLGNSITWGYGSSSGNGYRQPLLELLTNDVTYIGSEHSGNMTNNDNEGHPGAIIDQIALYAEQSLTLRPNIILLMAGTNDMVGNFDVEEAPGRLGVLIDRCVAACPDAVVLVAQLTPFLDPLSQMRADVFNAAIPGLVKQRVNEGMKILAVDMMQPSASSHTKHDAPPTVRSLATDRSLLTPEDAIYQGSPPRKQSDTVKKLQKELRMTNSGNSDVLSLPGRGRNKVRSGSRRRKGTWKKLLWVKQSYNYTDQETFLGDLQRNPRLQPYDFWPLVADSTVIVQHVCSVIVFIVCFVGILQKQVSPGAVVGWGSISTFLGWVLWDSWVGQEEANKPATPRLPHDPSMVSAASSVSNLAIPGPSNLSLSARHSHSASASSIHSTLSTVTSSQATTPKLLPNFPSPNHSPHFSHRTSLRLGTAKSALLIYFTLLGLSPILKSLTLSTSSDSIWAMSFMLFAINIFFFDYGSPAPSSSINSTNKNIPASLSTNAALMASTVLASRLPSTGEVFSLTLFSIEVFGLFPVFRRYARQQSWRGHVTLTTLLVVGAGGGVGLILGRGGDGKGILSFPWKSGIIGVVIGVLATGLAMGGCSWWLIGLQKYKNEIHGPWDPARPIIRRWDNF
ncbi:Phosphatidylinositol N-acetylglucosaminyltransferase GPI2 subunit [Hyphodiscus hymeniophilus]|uniref:Phosphatidylinositol N-acetylglucosaminyltransferase GPI2 subunit n=1 Tax=Hyphodiscus hymeniophilus TaxID=353542 RepID=A0A9P7AUQ8_9HELO|nr:Phosphatidylinositol N-acetylglucosaminyltransferase GPI2 subunit [Hyphodiscus hymeniophilus]